MKYVTRSTDKGIPIRIRNKEARREFSPGLRMTVMGLCYQPHTLSTAVLRWNASYRPIHPGPMHKRHSASFDVGSRSFVHHTVQYITGESRCQGEGRDIGIGRLRNAIPFASQCVTSYVILTNSHPPAPASLRRLLTASGHKSSRSSSEYSQVNILSSIVTTVPCLLFGLLHLQDNVEVCERVPIILGDTRRGVV